MFSMQLDRSGDADRRASLRQSPDHEAPNELGRPAFPCPFLGGSDPRGSNGHILREDKRHLTKILCAWRPFIRLRTLTPSMRFRI
jgi:hypothetical protein